MCGAKVVGYTSLSYEKKNIRLYFRSEFGPSRLEYPVFRGYETGLPASDSFDALTLRNSHDSVFYLGARGQYLRNLFMDESQLEMGHMVPHGRHAHVYINGHYRGMYHVRERFNDAFMADYMGGEEDDYETINAGSVEDGSGVAWAAAKATAGDWDEVQHWVDVQNFLDYMILNYYAANAWDWYSNWNWMAAGPSAPDQGGYRFHSSDSDICIYYPWDQNILSLGGPDNLFFSFVASDDPDFWVLLQDRIQALLLDDDGPLTAENAVDRYSRISATIERMVVAESARWGGGWWERDDEWETERVNLLTVFFPYRTNELLRQFREAGWFRLEAPLFSRAVGPVSVGDTLTVTRPDGVVGDLWVTTNGEDPRLSGGDVNPAALGPDDGVVVEFPASTVVQARVLDRGTWSALRKGFFEVDAAPALVLNEWNAVDPGNRLKDGGVDMTLGVVDGNGGDWTEWLVLQDHLDVRGWRLTFADRRGTVGDLTFTDDPLLADLRAGTLFTVAEDLPEDGAYDPTREDWRFHLRASDDGTGRYVTAADFDVSHTAWQATVQDAQGHVRFGPVGEGVSPVDGISGSEVGVLTADPSGALRRTSDDYKGSGLSSFGSPNAWDDGTQDLEALRHPGGVDVVGDSGTAPWVTEDTDEPGPGDGHTPPVPAGGCGCDHGSRRVYGTLAVVLAVVLAGRRRRAAWLVGLAACRPAITPVDKGESDDSPVVDTAPEVDTAAPCWADADGDGHGDPATPRDCDRGGATDATDCDDADPLVHPGAFETCDDQDDDCDGLTDDADPDLVDGVPFYADVDGDGWGGDPVTSCHLGDGQTTTPGDCDDANPDVHPGVIEGCDGVDRNCDGVTPNGASGVAEGCPATSCAAARDAGFVSSGPTWITLPSGTVPLWCDQTVDGGGWVLGLVINSVADEAYTGFGSAEKDLDALAVSPEESSSGSLPAAGWLDLNTFDWTTMRVTAYAGGSLTWSSVEIPRSSLRIDFGQPGYLLFGGDTPYYWCGGPASYTDTGVGAVNNPPGATLDCKGHGSLGSGWDFSEADVPNAGLTLCGGDASNFLASTWGGGFIYYPSPGGAQALWVR